MTIDLNCDMGEGMNNDHLLMPLISSANIACGFHAGNRQTMETTIALAKKFNVKIGAHISFHDRDNFGRTEMDLPKDEMRQLIQDQLEAITTIASDNDVAVHHVKPHGALYNMSARDKTLAALIAFNVKEYNSALIIYGLSGSHSIKEAEKLGMQTASEVFADRTYQEDGSLTSRKMSNAIISDTNVALQQVLAMITEQTVISVSGKRIPIKADTICIHGDNVNAVAFANMINKVLIEQGIAIKSIESNWNKN